MVAVVANIGANYVLIWGHFGFPEARPGRRGVGDERGGGRGGRAARRSFVLTPKIRKTYFTLEWRPAWDRVRTLMKIGLPSGFQMIGDVMAWAVFGMWVMAFFGTEAMAANTFMMRFMQMSFLPTFGLSAGVTALVGRYIGRGMPDVAAAAGGAGLQGRGGLHESCAALIFAAVRSAAH